MTMRCHTHLIIVRITPVTAADRSYQSITQFIFMAVFTTAEVKSIANAAYSDSGTRSYKTFDKYASEKLTERRI